MSSYFVKNDFEISPGEPIVVVTAFLDVDVDNVDIKHECAGSECNGVERRGGGKAEKRGELIGEPKHDGSKQAPNCHRKKLLAG